MLINEEGIHFRIFLDMQHILDFNYRVNAIQKSSMDSNWFPPLEKDFLQACRNNFFESRSLRHNTLGLNSDTIPYGEKYLFSIEVLEFIWKV